MTAAAVISTNQNKTKKSITSLQQVKTSSTNFRILIHNLKTRISSALMVTYCCSNVSRSLSLSFISIFSIFSYALALFLFIIFGFQYFHHYHYHYHHHHCHLCHHYFHPFRLIFVFIYSLNLAACSPFCFSVSNLSPSFTATTSTILSSHPFYLFSFLSHSLSPNFLIKFSILIELIF